MAALFLTKRFHFLNEFDALNDENRSIFIAFLKIQSAKCF